VNFWNFLSADTYLTSSAVGHDYSLSLLITVIRPFGERQDGAGKIVCRNIYDSTAPSHSRISPARRLFRVDGITWTTLRGSRSPQLSQWRINRRHAVLQHVWILELFLTADVYPTSAGATTIVFPSVVGPSAEHQAGSGANRLPQPSESMWPLRSRISLTQRLLRVGVIM